MSTFSLNTHQPEISEHPQNQIVLEGLNVSFLCNATGNPTPTLSWTINGSPVNTTSNPRIRIIHENAFDDVFLRAQNAL